MDDLIVQRRLADIRDALSIAAGWARTKGDSDNARTMIKRGLDATRELATALQSAEARNRVLVEALEPFASRGARYGSTIGDDWVIDESDGLIVAELRRAAEALAKTKEVSDG